MGETAHVGCWTTLHHTDFVESIENRCRAKIGSITEHDHIFVVADNDKRTFDNEFLLSPGKQPARKDYQLGRNFRIKPDKAGKWYN